jgi:hypothetical protein
VQFAGRGGIRRRSLPANGAAGSPVDLMPQGWKEKAIRDFLTRDDFLARDGD